MLLYSHRHGLVLVTEGRSLHLPTSRWTTLLQSARRWRA